TGLLVGSIATHAPNHPPGAAGVRGTIRLARNAGPALQGGPERHGMAPAAIPGLEAEIARRERAARALLDRHLQAGPAAATDSPLQSVLRGESGRALGRCREAIRDGDGAKISASAAERLETPPARLWMQSGQAQLDARDAQSTSARDDVEARQAAEAVLAR